MVAVTRSKKLRNYHSLCEDVLGNADLLGLIVNKIKDPKDRKSFSEVCREWLRVEGLHRSSIRLPKLLRVEGLHRSTIRLRQSQYLRKILPRFPNLVKFETLMSIKDSDLVFLAQTCPKLEFINLRTHWYFDGKSDFVGLGLLAVAKGCPNLAKVDLYNRDIMTDSFHVLFCLASNLTHLDLSCCWSGVGVSEQVVEAIACSHSIVELNLASNQVITDRALGYLADGNCSKSLKTLILDCVHQLTDVGVTHLRKMHCLEHLSLAYNNISDNSSVSISAITTLKKLSLQGLRKLSDRTIAALAQNCPSLKILDLSDCDGINGHGIRAFSGHQCLETIRLPPRNVSGSDLDHLVLGCPSLKSISMPVHQMRPLRQEMQESTRKLVDHLPLNLDMLNFN